MDEKGELLKMEAEPEEPDEDTEGGRAPKHQVTQSVISIRDTKRKENIQKQERQWFALTGKKSTTSASLGAPTETMVTTEWIGVRQGQSKKKTMRSKRRNTWHCNMLKFNYGKRSRNVKSKKHSRHC